MTLCRNICRELYSFNTNCNTSVYWLVFISLPHKFSKLLRCCISYLPGKCLKGVFSFQISAQVKCCPRATSWTGLLSTWPGNRVSQAPTASFHSLFNSLCMIRSVIRRHKCNLNYWRPCLKKPKSVKELFGVAVLRYMHFTTTFIAFWVLYGHRLYSL